jgi:hypothetical protein
MIRIRKTASLIAFVALLSAGQAFTQSPSDEEISKPTAAPAPVAHVYVQTTKGVNVYDATAAGKLTLVKGSPFKTTGQMGGINGKYLISVGSEYLHAYAIESSGAIAKDVSKINPLEHGGAECSTVNDNNIDSIVTFDHSGKYFYFQIEGSLAPCAATQSYEIESNGDLAFLGDIEYESFLNGYAWPSSAFSISSNDRFAYGAFDDQDNYSFSTFARTPGGVMEVNEKFTEIDPVSDPEGTPDGPWRFYPLYNDYPGVSLQQADSANHMAVLLGSESGGYDTGNYRPAQLASYTINDTTGAIVSKNTWVDMPTPKVIGTMSMSTSGKLLAVAGGLNQPGLQLFHFNGAAPITAYSSLLLPDIYITQMAWDNNNHLYAVSENIGDDLTAGQLYVYTVTPTSFREVSGSPYRFDGAGGMLGLIGAQNLIVVPKL